MTMKDDFANRSREIHWPQGFDPTTADLFSHNELLIKASCERVWQHIVDASKWPEWYPNSKDVRIVGDGEAVLKAGTTFRWTTFGLPMVLLQSRCKLSGLRRVSIGDIKRDEDIGILGARAESDRHRR